MLLARWASPVVMRYVGEAPLDKLTEKFRAKVREGVQDRVMDGNWAPELIQRQLDAISAEVSRLEDSVRKLGSRSVEYPTLVQNSSSKVMHKVAVGNQTPNPKLWKAVCGWRFAASGFTFHLDMPCACRRCDRCFSDADVSE